MKKIFTVKLMVNIALAVVLSAVMLFVMSNMSKKKIEDKTIGGEFTLTDQNGKKRSSSEFRDKYMLVFFGFTFCPDICPTGLATISDALYLLEEGDKEINIEANPELVEQIVPVFITVDPARDTVEVMKEYIAEFHPNFVALTGDEKDIQKVTQLYKAYYKLEKEGADDKEYMVDHSGFIYLMGKDGEYIQHFSPFVDAMEIAEKLSAIDSNK